MSYYNRMKELEQEINIICTAPIFNKVKYWDKMNEYETLKNYDRALDPFGYNHDFLTVSYNLNCIADSLAIK
jgi:hypothetical protein